MAILLALRKFFWIVNLAFLTLAAYLSAGIVGSVIESRVVSKPEVNVEAIAAKARTSARSYQYYQPVLDRNIFDSSAVPMDDDELGSDLEPSSLNVQLLGTIAGPNQRTSFAIVLDKSTSLTDVYGVGDKISGAKVVRIERGIVTVLLRGKEEVLMLPDIKTAAPGGRMAKGRGVGGPSDGMYADGITQKDGESWQVDQKLVDDALGDLSSLMTQARIVPHMKDGQIDGFKVYNIKSNSLFSQLGLKNGDILHSVNGMDISGPEQGLQAFQTLRNERSIQIDLTRRGSRKTLNYTIR